MKTKNEYRPTQNGFLGQELRKTLLRCEPSATETQIKLIEALALELTLARHGYVSDLQTTEIEFLLSQTFKEFKKLKIEKLEKELATLKGCEVRE